MAAFVRRNPPIFAIEEFLAAEQKKDLLRFTTAGSVDDGKSTLIGRLLYDSKRLRRSDRIDAQSFRQPHRRRHRFLPVHRWLRAEREQGITIDVAYRYFCHADRKFIIADTPGHEQYTRNMATGASTADLAIMLIDARNGVMPQSRRHAFIASLLGIPHIVVAVNKMDLVGFDDEVFRKSNPNSADFSRGVTHRPPSSSPSARCSATTSSRRRNMPWFDGPNLLEHLETVDIPALASAGIFAFPCSASFDPRGFPRLRGQIVSGAIRPGDPVYILPAGRRTTVKSIATFDGDPDIAYRADVRHVDAQRRDRHQSRRRHFGCEAAFRTLRGT